MATATDDQIVQITTVLKKLKEEDDNIKSLLNMEKDNLLKELKNENYGGLPEGVDLDEKQINTIKQTLLTQFIKESDFNKDIQSLRSQTDIKEIKDLLGQLGLEGLTWLKPENIADIRKEVVLAEFGKNIDTLSDFGKEAYPKLMQTFSNLPLDKQIEIVESKTGVWDLIHATSTEATVRRYVGQRVPATDINGILEENRRLDTFRGIHNPEIAKMLEKIRPPITLNQKSINLTNLCFVEKNPEGAYKYKELNEEGFKKLLLEISPQKRTHEALGLTGSEVNEEVLGKVNAQHAYNEHLLNSVNNPDKKQYQSIYNLLLSSNKDFAISEDMITTMETAFDSSSNVAQVLGKIDDEGLKKLLQKELTSSVFHAVKTELSQKNLTDKSESDIQKEIESLQKIRKDLDPVKKKLDKLNKDASRLIDVTDANKTSFEKQRLKKEYNSLAQWTVQAIEVLQQKKEVLAHYTLMANPDNNQKIKKLKLSVDKELDLTNKEIDFYEKVRDNFHRQDGILDRVEDMGNKVWGVKSDSFKVKIVSELESPEARASSETTHALIKQVNETRELRDKIPQGKMRQYDFYINNTAAGQFTAKVTDDTPIYTASGKGIQNQSLDFEVTTFPKKGAWDKAQQRQAEYSMAFAVEFLSNLSAPPTKDKPILLQGKSEEELKNLWTAFALLGRENPHLKFNTSAIKVFSHHFDPKSEMGTFETFGRSSLYATVYKNNPIVESYVKDLKEISFEKAGRKADQQALDKKITNVHDHFKQSFKTLKDEAEAIQKEEPEERPKPVIR